jgi:hypothetical protein
MRTTGLRVTSDLVHQAFRVTSDLAHERRAMQRAIRRMPKPMPWAWAEPRLLPFVSGPSFDGRGEALVRTRAPIGPMVEFGVDLGGLFTFVDEVVAQRWECTPQQLMGRALLNLEDRASRIQRTDLVSGVMNGRRITMLRGRPTWASSLVLVPQQLFRLFGDHDQIVGTPETACLVSLPIDTPGQVVADIVVQLEWHARRPLWVNPFVVTDGHLTWVDDLEDDLIA